MNKEIRIVLADDHPVFRKGLSLIVASTPGFLVVGEAADGHEAARLCSATRPDVALLDIEMPGRSGLDIVREVRANEPGIQFIMLTMYKDEFLFNDAMDAGALGYVLKDSAIEEVVESIRAVVSGDYYISPAISTFLVRRSNKRSALRTSVPTLDDLTPAEKRILLLIADGKTTAEIAAMCVVSAKTVENHRANISQKLNLRGTHSLVKFAIANKSHL